MSVVAKTAADAPRVRAAALWAQQQRANAKNYDGFPLHSCSVAGHPGAQRFRSFLRRRADPAGRLLDVGCGPQPLPAYLEGWDFRLLHGIDPLPPAAGEHPFAFVRGYGERLPWPDGHFTTVVYATSLDHMIDPLRSIREARRVLLPTGRLFVWCTLWPDAKPYDPDDPPAALADDCHAYHLGDWFLRGVEQHFTLESHQIEPPNDFLEFAPK